MIRTVGLVGIAIGCGLMGISSASAQPAGSYRQSCSDVDQRGPILSAMCRDVRGEFRSTQLDLRDCGRGQVANSNGRLVCVGGAGTRSRRQDNDEYGGPPPGSGYGRPGGYGPPGYGPPGYGGYDPRPRY